MNIKTHKIINITFAVTLFLTALTTISATVLSRIPDDTNAATESVTASVTVSSACTMSGNIASGNEHTDTVQNSSYTPNIGETTISVNCNDANGYSVYAVGYTGNTEGNTTMIGSTTSLTIPTGTVTDASVSNWAMKLTAAGTNAPTILSDTNGAYSSYHVVPNTATKVATLTTNTASTSQIKTTYAVAISSSQPADTYTGQVKYTVVHPNNANADGTLPPDMQDFTLSQCQQNVGTNGNPARVGDTITVIDKRDGSDYTVRYINNNCWMTQNLRITGTISSEYSNFTGADINVSQYSNDSNDANYLGYCDGDNGYNNPCSNDSGSTTTGVWYNFAAATAGQITGSSNTDSVTQDICPAGWRLPTADEINSIRGDSYVSAFSPTVGGRIHGSRYNTDWSWIWASTSCGGVCRRILQYDNGVLSYNGFNRYYGIFIRCVHS